MSELINILTRTANRPNYFRNCFESCQNQSYKNIRHIISVDNKETEEYVAKYTNDYIFITDDMLPKNTREIPSESLFPWNLYLSVLSEQCESGWILFIDDDDQLIDNTSIQKMVDNITSIDDVLFWRVKFGEILIPEDDYFYKPPALCHISGIGFLFHTTKLPYIEFDAYKCIDYRIANNLYYAPNTRPVYINQILTGLQRPSGWGGLGKKDDI